MYKQFNIPVHNKIVVTKEFEFPDVYYTSKKVGQLIGLQMMSFK